MYTVVKVIYQYFTTTFLSQFCIIYNRKLRLLPNTSLEHFGLNYKRWSMKSRHFQKFPDCQSCMYVRLLVPRRTRSPCCGTKLPGQLWGSCGATRWALALAHVTAVSNAHSCKPVTAARMSPVCRGTNTSLILPPFTPTSFVGPSSGFWTSSFGFIDSPVLMQCEMWRERVIFMIQTGRCCWPNLLSFFLVEIWKRDLVH